MKLRISTILLASLIGFFGTTALAADGDRAGSKDHPLLTRYPNSHITEYEKNYNEFEFLVGLGEFSKEQRQLLEGDVTKLRYYHNNRDDQPSPLQVLRNYENAIKEIGGETVFMRKPRDTYSGEGTFKVTVKDREFWIAVKPEIYSAPTQSYQLTILERKAMTQVVSASTLLNDLNAKGFITLYLNFDTNKWDIKPESQPTLKEVSKMLGEVPDLKVGIEGHTDNVGTAEANKILSQNRASSVMTALVNEGVAPARMEAVGFGQERPIADNRSEEGRAKNRRVEIVKR